MHHRGKMLCRSCPQLLAIMKLLFLIAFQFETAKSGILNVVDSSVNTTCTSGENCTVICEHAACSSRYIQCPTGFDCDITCDGWESCDHATINCNNSTKCDIKCDALRACDYATIYWPSNKAYSLACNGDWACRGIIFDAPFDNQSFSFECDDSSCYGLTINGPRNAPCHITSSGWDTNYAKEGLTVNGGTSPEAYIDVSCGSFGQCRDAQFNGYGTVTSCIESQSCYNAKLPIPTSTIDYTLNCEGSSACLGAYITCPSHAECDIICDGEKACQGADITCPSHAECRIVCDGETACEDAYLTCPSHAECHITCDGDFACEDAIIIPPMNESYATVHCINPLPRRCPAVIVEAPFDDEPFEWICADAYSCNGWTINCPHNALCNISTDGSGYYSKFGITVNGGETIESRITTDCAGYGACGSATFNGFLEGITSCSESNACAAAIFNGDTLITECVGYGACANAIFNGYGVISLCSGSSACYNLQFPDGPNDNDYALTCDGEESCAEADVKCPADAQCDIVCNGYNGVAACTELQITAPYDLSQLHLVCNMNNIEYSCVDNSIFVFTLPPTTPYPTLSPFTVSPTVTLTTTNRPSGYPTRIAIVDTSIFGVNDTIDDDNVKQLVSSRIVGIIAVSVCVFLLILLIGVIYRVIVYYKVNNSIVAAIERNVGESNASSLSEWLTSTVGLAQYLDLFVSNGYDSLEFVTKIKDKSELIEIGIVIPGHRTQIMSEIETLQNLKQIIPVIVDVIDQKVENAVDPMGDHDNEGEEDVDNEQDMVDVDAEISSDDHHSIERMYDANHAIDTTVLNTVHVMDNKVCVDAGQMEGVKLTVKHDDKDTGRI